MNFSLNTSLAYIKNGNKAAVKAWESFKNYNTGVIIPGDGDDAYINCCFGKIFRATEEFENISKEIVDLLDLEGKK